MSISDIERTSVHMYIRDGQLHIGKVRFRHDAVTSVDVAVHRLLLGEEVWLIQVAHVVACTQRTVEHTLALQA